MAYDFCELRAGEHARKFLGDWQGSLVCDDFRGYKQSFTQGGITEAGSWPTHVANSSICMRPTKASWLSLHSRRSARSTKSSAKPKTWGPNNA
ncbi:transposase [Comamonas sp. EJ-4]|nr:transposase [Comamonas suwonensis]